ncbi:hypothetical protein B0H34DRAFT_716445 [Crassisporium funariophilum]|nr:hypothetical protein B0H34DRAFT_716445 [Crassisporium funariophilum]
MAESAGTGFMAAAMSVSGSAEAAADGMISLAVAARFQNYSSLSALILFIWDHFNTLPDGIAYLGSFGMYSAPWTLFTWPYLFARYIGLIFQLTNNFVLFTRISQLPVSYDVCKGWYAFQILALWCLFSASDMVVMLRVYELYQRSWRIGLSLITLHSFEALIASICGWRTLNALSFDPACNAWDIPVEAIVFAASVIISQCTIWTLTLMKRDVKDGERASIMKTILRDLKWAWAWFILLSVFGAVIPYFFIRQYIKPHLIFSWPMTILSIATYRLVLNMHKTPKTPPNICKSVEVPPKRRLHIQDVEQARRPRSQRRVRPHLHSTHLIELGRISAHTNNISLAHSSSAAHTSFYPSVFDDGYSTKETCTDDTSEDGNDVGMLPIEDIEIGSLHTSSSMDSRQMRAFWNAVHR